MSCEKCDCNSPYDICLHEIGECDCAKKETAKRDAEIERLRAEKKRIQDSNREYSASLVQEIVSLKDDNTRLREALSIVEGCNSPSCNCAEIARAALGEGAP